MAIEDDVKSLQIAIATLQGQVSGFASKITLKQSALLTESTAQTLTESLAALEARVTVLENA
jgi:hypothetical protein